MFLEVSNIKLLVFCYAVYFSRTADATPNRKDYFMALSLETCPLKPQPLGCFKDYEEKRVLKEQIINVRDNTSTVWVDPSAMKWGNSNELWENFETTLPGFICECARRAREKGYSVIGIQYYIECWAGNEEDIDMIEPSDDCKTGKYLNAKYAKKECVPSAGEQLANYVYRIAEKACPTMYKAVGCYKDSDQHISSNEDRPLPHLVHSERQIRMPPGNGILIDWKNWLTFSPQMICRCATAAKEQGYELFSIEFWGECWAGTKNEMKTHSYQKDGPSRQCSNEYFESCGCNSYCVGKAFATHAYELL